VNNFYFREVLQTLEHLSRYLSQQVFVHASEAWLLDVFVQVAVEQLKHDDEVLAEVKAVKHFDDAVFVRVLPKDAFQKFGLNACIVCLLLFVFADLDGERTATVFHVDAAHHLAESTRINDVVY